MAFISVTRFLKQCPEYRSLHRNEEWITEYVGNSYDYDDTVYEYQLYAYNGVFMELFIRKCLCRRFNLICEDDRTQKLLKNNRIRNQYFGQELMQAYAAYCDWQTRAIDIIEAIKVVALSHRLSHHGDAEDLDDAYNMNVNVNNLKEVVRFLNNLPYGCVMYKEPFEFHYRDMVMRGVPDFIFDEHVFCQIATSMHRGVYKRKYAQVLLYLLCHYKENYYDYGLQQEYTVMIYNPLLGATYSADVLITPWVYENLHSRIGQDLYGITNSY